METSRTHRKIRRHKWEIMVKRYLELRSLDEALSLLTSSFAAPKRTERFRSCNRSDGSLQNRSLQNIPCRR